MTKLAYPSPTLTGFAEKAFESKSIAAPMSVTLSAGSWGHDDGPRSLRQQLQPCLSASHRYPTAIAEA